MYVVPLTWLKNSHFKLDVTLSKLNQFSKFSHYNVSNNSHVYHSLSTSSLMSLHHIRKLNLQEYHIKAYVVREYAAQVPITASAVANCPCNVQTINKLCQSFSSMKLHQAVFSSKADERNHRAFSQTIPCLQTRIQQPGYE